MNSIGFTDSWFSLGMITPKQAILLETQFLQGDDPNPEHFRWRIFVEFLASQSLTEELAENLFLLAESDPDQAARAAMIFAVIERKDCPESLKRRMGNTPARRGRKRREERTERTGDTGDTGDMIDISRPLQNGIAVWPGDTAFSLTQSAWGDLTVGAVALSLHTGTHADAPGHFLPGGATIEQIPPEVYVGECEVIDGRGKETLGPELLPKNLPPRVLVRTDAWPDGSSFPATVPTLTRDAVEVLRAQGVFLVGVDVPSVDAIDSKGLPIHHDLARAGIHILESLDLSRVEPGNYTLIALPLPLKNGDASPVRAVLISGRLAEE